MSKIYVPQDATYNKCYVVQSEGVIRGYNKSPAYNTDYSYRDYYINSDYIYKDGTGSWGNSSYYGLPVCLSQEVVTNEVYYRIDYDKSLFIFLIFALVIFYIPTKVFLQIFRRRH